VTFELVYPDWSVGGHRLTEHVLISLDAGSNLNRIQITFDGSGSSDSLQFACGLVKRNATTTSRDNDNHWVGLWGPTTNDTANGSLGTGIVFSPSSFDMFTEDQDQYLVIGRTKVGHPFVYYCGAGWTRSGDFATGADWKVYLNDFARRLLFPLEIKIHED